MNASDQRHSSECFAYPTALRRKHHAGLHLYDYLCVYVYVPAVCFPLWFALAAHITPRRYIRFAVTTIAACYCLAFVAIFQPVLIDVSIIPIGGLSLVGIVLLSLGFLGEDGIEVSEVSMQCLSKTGQPVKACERVDLQAAVHLKQVQRAGIVSESTGFL